jgi:hypothetical protein
MKILPKGKAQDKSFLKNMSEENRIINLSIKKREKNKLILNKMSH